MALSKLTRYCLESSPFFSKDILNMRQGSIFLKKDRIKSGEYKIYREIRTSPNQFFEYTKMSVMTFDYILRSIRPLLKASVKGQRVVSPTEKLFITLRYLSTGLSFQALGQAFRLGKSTVGKCIYQTCKAISKILMPIHMHTFPIPTTCDLINISKQFYTKWQFPNCIGAIGSREFYVKKFIKTEKGASYKKMSLELQGVADADYKFIHIEFGIKKQKDDDGMFFNSKLNDLISTGKFNVPTPQALPGSNISLPHVLLGDEAYPVKWFLLRPYPPRNIDDAQRNYNHRLFKARSAIENAFSMLMDKWQIFHKPIGINVKHFRLLLKVACLLHNIILDREGVKTEVIQLLNESRVDKSSKKSDKKKLNRRNNRSTLEATQTRDHFKVYLSESRRTNNEL